MESSFYPTLMIPILLLAIILHNLPSINSQQDYINNTQLDCNSPDSPSIAKGYVCNGIRTGECQFFITFQSSPPYFETPLSIANLLGSDPSIISSINNITSTTSTIPSGTWIIVPVSCSCSGSIYQHNTLYTIRTTGETYFTIANNTFQGLTTCQALAGQNYFAPDRLYGGSELNVPLRCACPSENQGVNGVVSLLGYMVTWGDSISSIAARFGVSGARILEANRLRNDSVIFPFSQLLVPLDTQSCSANPDGFYCGCRVNPGICISQKKKFPVKLVTLLGIGIGIGLLASFLILYKLIQYVKRRKKQIYKQKMFKQNGGVLLQQKLTSYPGGTQEKAKLFTEEELKRATDNYNQSRFLGQGGYGTVYKGMLPDGTIVAVKKSKTIDKTQIQQFINEVVILSQINHRHIVKLLGCCLETELPLLVYEFIPNGTLSSHIHEPKQVTEEGQESNSSYTCLSWEDRFRIAGEVAGAVAYMHSAASFPIYHRDIKSTNILLDAKLSGKVSDFGTSKSVPDDKTHLTTMVQGTFGYLDPEYFHTSQFTDKSDVYSFGVVLVELLTGQKPISFTRGEEERSLVAHFVSAMKEEHGMVRILDPVVRREGREADLGAIAELAVRCLRLNGKKRPTMREVAMELDGLRNSHQRCLALQVDDQEESFVETKGYHDQLHVEREESMDDSFGVSVEMESV